MQRQEVLQALRRPQLLSVAGETTNQTAHQEGDSGDLNLGNSLVVRKQLVPEKTEQQKKDELSDFDIKSEDERK